MVLGLILLFIVTSRRRIAPPLRAVALALHLRGIRVWQQRAFRGEGARPRVMSVVKARPDTRDSRQNRAVARHSHTFTGATQPPCSTS